MRSFERPISRRYGAHPELSSDDPATRSRQCGAVQRTICGRQERLRHNSKLLCAEWSEYAAAELLRRGATWVSHYFGTEAACVTIGRSALTKTRLPASLTCPP